MRHTLLFISSVALAAVLSSTTTYAEEQVDAAKSDQTETAEQSAETAETSPEMMAEEAAQTAQSDTDATSDEATSESTDDATRDAETAGTESDPAQTSETETASESAEPAESEASAETTAADASVTPSEGAAVYIIYPSDGSEVTSPVKVVFGLDGLGVAPAGVDVPNTGHHHLIIDGGDELPPAGEVMGDNVMHFGGGQTEADIELEPGEHTLQLILGDKDHKPFEPSLVSEKITIKVIEP